LQAENLKSSRVCEQGFGPLHKAMQAVVLGDDLGAWTKPEVKGVTQYDLSADLEQLVGQHGLDGAIGADRHKNGRLDHAVIERHATTACLTVGGEKLKA
jgi:hypothetical protein